jgi:C-terminal processing protease CtpA/Prc
MRNKLVVGIVLSVLVCMHAESQTDSAAYTRANIADIFGFEVRGSTDLPASWSGGPPGTVAAENTVVHSGHWAVRLDRTQNPSGQFSAISTSIPVDFAGARVELRGFLRTENVSGFAGLWLREDGDSGVIALDNMQSQNLSGTHDWQDFTVALPLDSEARHLFFGVLLAGGGIEWADDLQLLVDGKPVAQAPQRAPEKAETDQETDKEFDRGSRIQLKELTPLEVNNLATLAQVWGFLKYHHPAITAGKRRWDYELFRIMPRVLSARSCDKLNAILANWIDALGPVDECSDCASLDSADLKLKPDLDWIRDTRYLDIPLSRRLQTIYRNRVRDRQYYVALTPVARNPIFRHESQYTEVKLPDSGFQLLGLFRLWNVVEYWAPYRDVAGESWPGVLKEFIPRVATAADRDAYGRAMLAMTAEIHDTHANFWKSLYLRPPPGSCRLPVDIRFVNDSAVVAGYTSESKGKASGLEPGDEISGIDGVPLGKLIAEWTPLYADSNSAARLRDMARNLTNGNCGPVHIDARRGNHALTVNAVRMQPSEAGTPTLTHDLPGPTFRLLSKDVAYLKLSSVKAADVPQYVQGAKGTRGLIVDIRNYPSEFVVFALGSLLVRQVTPFVVFSTADLSNPGAFHTISPITLTPSEPHYGGKVVIVVDEVTQSQAEYTTMALRSSPGAIVVGSTTAGADGNVSDIPLPGGFGTMISGLGVFYPDGAPTQRVGIHVDLEAHPSIAGIRAGRDEVLEAAIRQIVPELPESEAEKLAASH